MKQDRDRDFYFKSGKIETETKTHGTETVTETLNFSFKKWMDHFQKQPIFFETQNNKAI